MMLKDYIAASQKRMIEQVSNFYTSNGIQVYFKDQLLNDKIDVEKIVSDFERVVPRHLLEEVEMIIIGHFDEFEERDLTAFYKDGALHLSNMPMDENEEFDKFLFQDVGYKKLGVVVSGIFLNAYAPTALREYFATAFADFYLNPNDHTNLKNLSPILYKKIALLHNLDKSD